MFVRTPEWNEYEISLRYTPGTSDNLQALVTWLDSYKSPSSPEHIFIFDVINEIKVLPYKKCW